MREKAQLYIVPTPIGNMEDITLRAINILKDVDVILAEDTRKTGILLKHLQIQKPMVSYHNHNEHKIVESVLGRVENGEIMALVSDAGTPGISDPGYLLVRECLKRDIALECLPGATAFVPALIKSGLPTDSFVFEGFLPYKKGRKTKLEQLANETRTIVLYESPHRLLKTLEQLSEHFGPTHRISVSRELTKLYEETKNGTIAHVLSHFQNKAIKGEIVIVIEGRKG
ncbi:MAG: 16S rRNA (cytidine(1402)-2'-O)-methyltransferase [Bacteroidota bacterium]